MTTITQAPCVEGRLFIGGVWREGEAGTQSVVDPGTEQVIGDVSLASRRDVEDALLAADAGFQKWRATCAQQRGAVLCGAASLIRDRRDDIATTLVFESGKPRADARAEIARAADTLDWNGQQAVRITGARYAGIDGSGHRISVPTPLGVVVAVTAWNFPAVLVARKLGAALAAGCSVVLKASESCPATARALVQALMDAGLPDGVVNLLFGDPPRVTAQLLRSPLTRALSFTGSTRIGRRLATLAAEGLMRCVLELGGHAPVLICEDADPEQVVLTTGPGKYGSAGQSCLAPTSFFVHRSLYDGVCSALIDQAQSLRLGHGSDPNVTLGPVANQSRVDELLNLTRDAVQHGATLLCGGRQLPRPGYFYEPTVLADVPQEAAIFRTEPFGPVTTVTQYSDLDQAIRMANGSDYALAAYVFTDSMRLQSLITDNLRASNIGINQMAPSLPDVPLGGMDDSGYGYEGGSSGIDAFLHYRLINTTTRKP